MFTALWACVRDAQEALEAAERCLGARPPLVAQATRYLKVAQDHLDTFPKPRRNGSGGPGLGKETLVGISDAELEQIAREVVHRHPAVAWAQVVGPTRTKALTTVRRAIIDELRKRGASTLRIGAVLHRDHATILYHLRHGDR